MQAHGHVLLSTPEDLCDLRVRQFVPDHQTQQLAIARAQRMKRLRKLVVWEFGGRLEVTGETASEPFMEALGTSRSAVSIDDRVPRDRVEPRALALHCLGRPPSGAPRTDENVGDDLVRVSLVRESTPNVTGNDFAMSLEEFIDVHAVGLQIVSRMYDAARSQTFHPATAAQW